MHNPIEDVELACNAIEVFHIPPYEGGSFDQPKKLLDDMFVWFAVKARMIHEQREAEKLNPDTPQYKQMSDPMGTVTGNLFD